MFGFTYQQMENPAAVMITTSALAFFSGFAFGVYTIRGYFLSPSLAEERLHNLTDPVESEASDIDDEDGIVLDHAPNWANGEEADVRDGLRVRGAGSSSASKAKPARDDEECKLVLVVRTDLGMTKGKIAAQCGHATLACYKTMLRAADKDAATARLLQRWERRGQAKIALQAKGEDTLLTLLGTAHSLGVTAEVIADAGRTQIDPGSLTVLGVGPAPKSLVDQVTGELKLL